MLTLLRELDLDRKTIVFFTSDNGAAREWKGISDSCGPPVRRGRDLDVRTGFRSRPVSVIRQGDWKLHLFHEEWVLDGGREKLATNDAVELYHLNDDVGERRNVAQEQPARRDAMLNDLLDWIRNTGAPIPSQPNPA